MITRKSLADTIDAYDDQIADLNKSKRETYDAYRDQMVAARLSKPEVKAEIEAVKVAIKRRRESVKDEHALIEKDALIDEVFAEITRAPRATREIIEKFATDGTKYDATSGEILDDRDVSAKLVATVATGMQTEIGRKALIAAVDIMIAREEAEEEFHTDPEEEAEAKGAATDDAEDRAEGDTDRQRSPEAGTTDGGRQGVREQVDSSPVPASDPELLGGFPVAAAEFNAEETGAIPSTRQGAGMERGMDQCVTGGESAATIQPETATKQRVNGHSQHEGANAQATVRNEVVTVVGTESGTVDNFETCERCQGNGEIVTDWDRYKHPREGDIGDEAVAECPDCGGEGIIDVSPDTEIASAAHGEAEAPSVDSETEPSILGGEDSPDANAGGDHVTAQAHRAASAGALVQVAPATNGVVFETCPPMPMKSLSYVHCFPELSKTEYQCLAGDIALNGVLEPIVRMGDVIVDGWNRYNAARSLGIEYPVKQYSGRDVLLDVIAWQRSSRDWTPQQERKIAAALAKVVPHRSEDIAAAFHLVDEEEPA